MITLIILFKLLFGGNKDETRRGFDAEEEDFEEMLVMGMIDED